MISRRRIVCAASALACSLVLASSAWGVYVRDYNKSDDFTEGVHERLSFQPELGGMALSKSINCVPYLWVPSPRDGTVAKIDARAGFELARYRIGPAGHEWSPCAVAVDAQGNAYVACTRPELIGRVVCITNEGGRDANADGKIATSSDRDANGRITPIEMLDWGNDDRVGPVIDVGSAKSAPTSLTFDGSGNLWVTLYGERALAKIDLSTKTVIAKVPLIGRPSLVVPGGRQVLWVLSREDRTLCMVNAMTDTIVESYDLGDSDPAGMCIDAAGKLWIADGYCGVIGFQPTGQIWSRSDPADSTGVEGIMIDPQGEIWATCPVKNQVLHLAKEDGSLFSSIPVGNDPRSLCADEDGYIWVLNHDANTVTRIDTQTEKTVLTVPTPSSPYSSTPFAAYVTRKGIAPDGSWRFVVDSGLRGAGWGRVTWDGVQTGGAIKVEVRSGDSFDILDMCNYVQVSSGDRFSVADGKYLEVRVTVTSRGDVSPVLRKITVEGTNHAPDVSKAVPTLSRITRTDHTMEPVCITGVTDLEGDEYTISILGVTQDEPISGLGVGDRSPDAMTLNGSSLWLRGELDPGTPEKLGNGRVYTVTFKATDSLGAFSTGKVTVSVPPGCLPTDQAIDDGLKVNSLKESDK